MNSAIFALVDCNNFFVSCERVFRSDLEGKPVVVLSSNDGCVIARSNQAKALGIPMGAPAFKYRRVFQDNSVVQFSANFELYGDMSRRITQILTELTPRTEIYSIDESFMDLSELKIKDYTQWGKVVRGRIWKEVGIPVSIGIASTKTLAKLASDRPKKQPELDGVLVLQDIAPEGYMQATPVEDVWGIGRRLSPKFRALGFATALDVRNMSPKHARQLMGVRGAQLVSELNGQTCFPLEPMNERAKSIARTRTFGEDTNELHVIESAIASFAIQAAYRLRRSNQLTRRAALFVTTNRNKPAYKSWSSEVKLSVPTADSGLLAEVLVAVLAKLFDKNQLYHRAGVWMYDFVPANRLQIDILGNVDLEAYDKSLSRMAALDVLNKRYGKNTVHFAAEDLARSWQPKQQLRSPRYVSNWDELPVATIRP